MLLLIVCCLLRVACWLLVLLFVRLFVCSVVLVRWFVCLLVCLPLSSVLFVGVRYWIWLFGGSNIAVIWRCLLLSVVLLCVVVICVLLVVCLCVARLFVFCSFVGVFVCSCSLVCLLVGLHVIVVGVGCCC